MKKITNEMYETRFPNTNYEYFNSEVDKEKYLQEYSLYSELLLMYLINNTSLGKIDNEIKECTNFKSKVMAIPETYQDLYQYLCSEKLTYFYIRNNIHIERLDEKERDYLDSLLGTNFVYNDEINSFIENTYKKLICEELKDKPYNINFGPSDSIDFFARNDSLVIGARMYQGFVPGEEDDFYDKTEYFDNKCSEIEELLNRELDINTKVIQYGEGSIKNITIEQSEIKL